MATEKSQSAGMPSCSTSTAANAPWPSAEGLIEASIPGFSILSGVLKSYFNLELGTIITILLPIAAVIAAWNYVSGPVMAYIYQYGVSSAEIRNDDEMYNYLMYWLSQQKFSTKTLSFIAGTRTSSDMVYDPYEDDSENESQGDDRDVDWQLAEDDFEQFWAQVTKKDKVRTLFFSPGDGQHWFRYHGHFIRLSRASTERQFGRYTQRTETLTLSCLGRDPTILKEVLKEAQKLYIERDGSSTVIYRKYSDVDDWQRCMARPPRPLSTVVLDAEQKNMIVEDIKEYLHPLTKRWYANRGIPYRRGYLLYGPPGTGKTSLCVALAGIFGLKVYVASLNSRTLTEEGLATLFGNLPQRCVVLLEDVDSAGITAKRAEDSVKAEKNDDGSEKDKTSGTAPQPTGISLSALLNVIDGVASSEGRILIMTTNHVEKLDPALLRPGRVDMSIAFENASTDTARELFKSTYITREEDHPNAKMKNGQKFQMKRKYRFSDSEIKELADKFTNSLPSGEFSPADIQGFLLKHKSTPQKASAGVSDWVIKTRAEKEKQKGLEPQASKSASLKALPQSVDSLTPPSTPILR